MFYRYERSIPTTYPSTADSNADNLLGDLGFGDDSDNDTGAADSSTGHDENTDSATGSVEAIVPDTRDDPNSAQAPTRLWDAM